MVDSWLSSSNKSGRNDIISSSPASHTVPSSASAIVAISGSIIVKPLCASNQCMSLARQRSSMRATSSPSMAATTRQPRVETWTERISCPLSVGITSVMGRISPLLMAKRESPRAKHTCPRRSDDIVVTTSVVGVLFTCSMLTFPFSIPVSRYSPGVQPTHSRPCPSSAAHQGRTVSAVSVSKCRVPVSYSRILPRVPTTSRSR